MDGINIAILDPLFRSRKNFVEALSHYSDVSVFEVMNWKELSGIMLKNDINLVVMELDLARESPYYILQTIRSNSKKKNIPVIVISSTMDRRSYIKSFVYGAVDFILKPIDKDTIAARILGYVKEENASVDSDGSVLMDLQEYMEFAFKMSSRGQYPLNVVVTTFFVDADRHSKLLDEEYSRIMPMMEKKVKAGMPQNGFTFPFGAQCLISFVPFFTDEEIGYLKNYIQNSDLSDIALSEKLRGLKISADSLKYDFTNQNWEEVIKEIPDIVSAGITAKKGKKF